MLVGASGLSYEDAAAMCGCAVGTMKSRVNRARAKLAAMLVGPASGSAGRDTSWDAAIDASKLEIAVHGVQRLRARLAREAAREGRAASGAASVSEAARGAAAAGSAAATRAVASAATSARDAGQGVASEVGRTSPTGGM